jgi:hypothetical protein
MVEIDEERISGSYRNHVNVEKAVELMRGQNISSESVKSVYSQLSTNADKLMTERFYYHIIKSGNYLLYSRTSI